MKFVRYAHCDVHIAPSFEQGCTMSEIGSPPVRDSKKSTWVQTERAAHEAWSRLIAKAPMAARLAHVLVAHMSPTNNAVVASQTTLGELMAAPGERPVHRNSVRNAINILVSERWIEVVQIGGKGGALAYIVNLCPKVNAICTLCSAYRTMCVTYSMCISNNKECILH